MSTDELKTELHALRRQFHALHGWTLDAHLELSQLLCDTQESGSESPRVRQLVDDYRNLMQRFGL